MTATRIGVPAVDLYGVQRDRQHFHNRVGWPARQTVAGAVDHHLLLAVLPVHRHDRDVPHRNRIGALDENGAVFCVHVLLVAGHHAARMDLHGRSVPDEVRARPGP